MANAETNIEVTSETQTLTGGVPWISLLVVVGTENVIHARLD